MSKSRRGGGRTAAFMSNFASSLLLQLVNMVVGLIVPRMLIAAYGSATNGLVSSITQMVTYVNLVEAGISAAAVFQLYAPLAKGDTNEVSRIVSAAKGFYYRSGGIFTAIMLALAIVYPFFVDAGDISQPEIFILVLALGATAFLDFFTLAKYRVLLTATQHNWVIQLASIVYKILYTVVVVLLAGSGVPVAVVYVVAIVPIVVRAVILITYVRRNHPEVDFSADARDVKLDQHWDAFYLQVLGAVQTGAPIVIATFVLGDLSMVSVLAVYLSVAGGIQSAASSVGTGTQASFGDVIARSDTVTLKRSFREFQLALYGAAGLLCGVSFALIIPFVRLYVADVADVNYIDPVIGFLVILNVLLYHLKTPQGLLVISAGLYRQTRFQVSLQTIILLVGAIVFGLLWGAPGILVGCCLSNLYRDIDLMFFIPRKVTHTAPSETFKLMMLSCAEAALVALPYILISPVCDSWAWWVLSAVVLLIWGIVTLFVLCRLLAPEQLSGSIERFARLFGLKRSSHG